MHYADEEEYQSHPKELCSQHDEWGNGYRDYFDYPVRFEKVGDVEKNVAEDDAQKTEYVTVVE